MPISAGVVTAENANASFYRVKSISWSIAPVRCQRKSATKVSYSRVARFQKVMFGSKD